MADGKGLPAPPDQQSMLSNMLSGIKSYFGMGDQGDMTYGEKFLRPVAQTRITQTPIWQMDIGYHRWPEGKIGEYEPAFDRINIRPGTLQDDPGSVIPHESTHALYSNAVINPDIVLRHQAPSAVQRQILNYPSAYPPLPDQANAAQIQVNRSMNANERLAYSVGMPEATPFIESVAGQILDPHTAQQLRRLHYNALGARSASYSKPGPYATSLDPGQEAAFRQWVRNKNIPFNSQNPYSDYDMRGFFSDKAAMREREARIAKGGSKHFPDTYKTPYHATFSNESRYATPDAPHWEGNRLIDKQGRVIADESAPP